MIKTAELVSTLAHMRHRTNARAWECDVAALVIHCSEWTSRNGLAPVFNVPPNSSYLADLIKRAQKAGLVEVTTPLGDRRQNLVRRSAKAERRLRTTPTYADAVQVDVAEK